MEKYQNQKLQNCKSVYLTIVRTFLIILDHDTIQRMNFLIRCFNVKFVEKWLIYGIKNLSCTQMRARVENVKILGCTPS